MHHKKVKPHFLNSDQYCRENESEQKKNGKCIYHLTESHPTEYCSLKKECYHILAEKQDSSTAPMNVSSKATEHLRNVKEELVEGAIDHDAVEDTDVSANGANQDESYHFAWLSNHICI